MRTRPDPVRAVVVDDSRSAQQLLVAILQAAEGIEVVGVGSDGEEAVRLTKRLHPDVVTMDVRMPKMDGLEATRCIMRDTPTSIVIVTADLMPADMNLTFEALRAGALTVVGKPGLADVETCEKVIRAVRLMAEVPVVRRWGRERKQPHDDSRVSPPRVKPTAPPASPQTDVQRRLDIIGIASSTGGPATLATILGNLPADFPVPILIVQHVTNGFVTGLAEWLDNVIPLRVGLVSHGEVPQPGTVLLAPDDYHLQVNDRGVMELYKGPPYKGLRPSANYLFHSLARAYGPSAAGIVLTGMGDDGAEGLLALRQADGLTIAQDEQSCVVYGMPHEAVARHAVEHVLSRDQIAPFLKEVIQLQKVVCNEQ